MPLPFERRIRQPEIADQGFDQIAPQAIVVRQRQPAPQRITLRLPLS